MRLSLCYVSTMSLFVLPVLLGPPLSLSLSLSLSFCSQSTVQLSLPKQVISIESSHIANAAAEA